MEPATDPELLKCSSVPCPTRLRGDGVPGPRPLPLAAEAAASGMVLGGLLPP